MGKALIAILSLVIGAALGVFFVAPVMTGAAAGVGIATGLSAGICATAQAAQEEAEAKADRVGVVRQGEDVRRCFPGVIPVPAVENEADASDVDLGEAQHARILSLRATG